MITEDITHIYRLARLLGDCRRELAERLSLRAGCLPSFGSRPLITYSDAALVNRCKLLRHWYSVAIQTTFGASAADVAKARDAELWARL